MKKIGSAFLMIFIFWAINALADQGQDLFQGLRCGTCHKPEITKTTPSLQDMAAAYQGKEEDLIRYFNGEAESIIKPEKANLMKRVIEKTKALSDAERRALADYILKHKK